MSNAEPPTAGTFTLDDYLQMVDNAESERGARLDSGGTDGASVETNASVTSRTSSLEADAAKKENDAAPSLSGMGIDQLFDIFAFLSLKDRVQVIMSSKDMLAQQAACDKSIRSLCVDAHNVGTNLLANRVEEATRAMLGQQSVLDIMHRSRQLQWSRLIGLRELDVGKHCTDHFLEMISGGASSSVGNNKRGDMLLPKMEVLKISSSYHVTEEALMHLATKDGSGRTRDNLQELDVTFCSNITYNAVIQFRMLLPNCLFRRLPQWMCGHTKTPFGEDGRVEVHTYWPDGAFSYNRDHQSKGFVVRVDMLSGQNHVSEKLQFIDLASEGRNMPDWISRGFRPSLSILRLEDNVDTQHILVAQRKGGIKHLKYFPKVEQAEMVPIGSSKHFFLDGNLVSEEDLDPSTRQGGSFTAALVSHMPKSKLTKEEYFSPVSLVSEIASHLKEIKETDEALMRRIMNEIGIPIPSGMSLEEMVEHSIGGTEVRENDFRYNEDMMPFPLNSDEPNRMSLARLSLPPSFLRR